MFIGIKKTKRFNFKEKIFFFFGIPVYKKLQTPSLKKVKLFGVRIYKGKSTNMGNDFYISKQNYEQKDQKDIQLLLDLLKIQDRHKELDLLIKENKDSLKELKTFYSDISQKPLISQDKINLSN